MSISAIVPTAAEPSGNNPKLRRAAADFEALFLHELMRDSRESTIDDEPLLGGGNAEAIWKDLFHSRLDQQAAGSVGIAQLLLKDLQKSQGSGKETTL